MLSPIQQEILEKLLNASTTPHAILIRAKIILHAAKNDSTYFIVNHLKVTWKTVQKWVERWNEYLPKFAKILTNKKNALRNAIIDCLSDAPRSGKPPIFTPEQVVKITSLACTTPKSHGVPLSHWSSRSLAQQVVKMQIVQKISHAKVAIFLKQGDFKPHRSQYWLNSRLRNTDCDFDDRVGKICMIYQTAVDMHKKGIHVISTDEKSGIQAIERIEIWFSGLSRQYLKRSNFTSTTDLEKGILNYIKWFNEEIAKPYKWTYKGKVLQS
jgi:putative transposase